MAVEGEGVAVEGEGVAVWVRVWQRRVRIRAWQWNRLTRGQSSHRTTSVTYRGSEGL